MWGLIIAAVWFLVSYLTGTRPEAAFLGSADFLFWWYLVCSVILVVLVVLPILGVAAVSLPRFLGGGWFGAAAAGLTGGVLVLFLAVLALKLALPIIGAWLLAHSGGAEMSFAAFDKVRLIVGAILVVLSFGLKANAKVTVSR
jgi:hypothetical protein